MEVKERQRLLEEIATDADKRPLLPEMARPPKSRIRTELQGLRAVAIIAVLLFHCWANTFKSGYLGVDVFFVISGYLMCHFLCRKVPLNSEAIWDFYFRRIKRIVPIYLFVCGFTLMVAKQYVSRLDYQQLIDEAIPSILFYSNSPSVHKTEYFDLRSKYFFFLHSWSLSVEIQFYLLVPLLFLLAQRLRRPVLIFGFGFLLFVGSFFRQFLADGVSKHMPLDGRIWQFMSGFAAHFIYEQQWISLSPEKYRTISKRFSPLVPKAVDFLLNSALAALLTFSVFEDQQLSRLLVIGVAAFFVALSQNAESFLSSNSLVALGDSSYSIYLVHWPILTLHRFLDEEYYADGADPSVLVGFALIVLSILIGHFVERHGVQLLREVTSWGRLLLTLLCSYTLLALILMLISYENIDMADFARNISIETIENDTLTLWNERFHPQPFNRDFALRYNAEIMYYGTENSGCHVQKRDLPTRRNISTRKYFCVEKGTGKKNIVVLGNSHAYHTYFGIKQHFQDLADNFTMVARSAYIPLPEAYQSDHMGPEGQHTFYQFTKASIKVLRKWTHKIHIVIALFGYGGVADTPPVVDWENDEIFNYMQTYYRNLSKIVKDVIIIPRMNLRFRRQQTKYIQEKLLAKKPLEEIGEPLERHLEIHPNLRERLDRVQCDKCVHFDYQHLWCGSENGTYCRSVELERGIALFLDYHHVTPYGSMIVGEAMRKTYDEFVANKTLLRNNSVI